MSYYEGVMNNDAVRSLQMIVVLPIIDSQVINVVSCKGFDVSPDKGQDVIVCCRCDFVRNALTCDFTSRRIRVLIGTNERTLFATIRNKYPFVDNWNVNCGDRERIVYPVRKIEHDIDLTIRKIREQMVLWRELRIAEKSFTHDQLFTKLDFHPVVFPSENVIRYERFGNDEGVEFKASDRGTLIRIVDMDKVIKSGKHMYFVNYFQIMNLLFPGEPEFDLKDYHSQF
jgi:hypothetical protein